MFEADNSIVAYPLNGDMDVDVSHSFYEFVLVQQGVRRKVVF